MMVLTYRGYMQYTEIGCVDIWLDEIVPCLKDNETGEIKETAVFKIESRSFLDNFTEEKGWGIDWNKIPKEIDVFALGLKDSGEIQGLVAVKNEPESKVVQLHWACTAPRNNKHLFGSQRYAGVGGHLFAIAVDMSIKWGYEGYVYGYALNKELLNHYIEVLGCFFVGIRHPYHFLLEPKSARKLLENYTYEWK